MRKISTLFAAMCITATVSAQTQRLVLFEEFTGETCPPCAQINPTLNEMLNDEADKIVSIKYQNNIPSAGPRFWPYAQTDIVARQTYYSNSYSPQGIMDGNQFNDNAGALDPVIINPRYATPSPFEVRVAHTFSAANDTIYASVIIKAAQNYNGSNLVAQIAVTERDIFGYTSPNGESHYEGVLRKMLPSASGTPLQQSWNAGDSVVLNYSWYITPAALSSPVYYQLSVIAFVQENSNKEVLQAGFSRAQVPMDPKAKAITGMQDVTCTGNITPTFTIANNGITDISTLDIQYKVDNNPAQTYSWMGLLPSFTNTTISLPPIPVSGNGSHSITLTTVNPNGGVTDNNMLNNSKTAYFGVPVAAVAGNVLEDFALSTFPPANWIRVDQNGNNTGWLRSTAGNGSAKIDFYSSFTGHIDNLYVYPVDMSGASGATMTFDVSHRQYSAAYIDAINVQVSTDCGLTWNTEWAKAGAALATVTGYQTGAFTPTTAAQWSAETVNLNQYAGNNNVLIRFNAVSGYGNNAYIDNVNVSLSTGINEVANTVFELYPNPTTGIVTIRTKTQNSDYKIHFSDISGKEVFVNTRIEGNIIKADFSTCSNGTYFAEIQTPNGTERSKFVLLKD
ncbi:MAG TPA: T9SS type A sorting domain-containing protein [Bacteroidia bacterium]|nr:T9SS type A sorting domain-containing protein [Bacteroidia bacterium]